MRYKPYPQKGGGRKDSQGSVKKGEREGAGAQRTRRSGPCSSRTASPCPWREQGKRGGTQPPCPTERRGEAALPLLSFNPQCSLCGAEGGIFAFENPPRRGIFIEKSPLGGGFSSKKSPQKSPRRNPPLVNSLVQSQLTRELGGFGTWWAPRGGVLVGVPTGGGGRRGRSTHVPRVPTGGGRRNFGAGGTLCTWKRCPAHLVCATCLSLCPSISPSPLPPTRSPLVGELL
jgi:hypothetical protein